MFDFEMFLVPSQWLLTLPTQVTSGQCTEPRGDGQWGMPQIPVKLATVATGNQENLGDGQSVATSLPSLQGVLTWGPSFSGDFWSQGL